MEQIACLLIHGIAGGQYQVEKLKDYLKDSGIYAESITIKGHEKTKKELVSTKYYEWLVDAHVKYGQLEKQYSKIVVIGFSMGGLLSINLAKRHDPLALVLVNCPIFYVNLPGVYQNIRHDLKERDFRNVKRYLKSENIPLRTLWQFVKLLEHTKMQLPKVTCKTLILQCTDDDVVVPKSCDYLFEHIGSAKKQMKKYEEGGHHIFMEDIDTTIYEDIRDYIANLAQE